MSTLTETLKLNLGDGSLYGNAIINDKSSFKVNIQEGIDSSTIIPNDFNVNPGQAMILFNTENAKLVQVRSNVRKEDTDMIQIFTNLETVVELTKDIPLTMEIR